jgi:hypothetical protein
MMDRLWKKIGVEQPTRYEIFINLNMETQHIVGLRQSQAPITVN